MRLILGRSGSGKTTFCMNEVKKYDAEAFSKPLLYIVPEQFSLEAERELINVLRKKGIINAQVLSFKRLAYKLFAEKGLKEKSLSSSGKAMLIYSIMLKHEDELEVLIYILDSITSSILITSLGNFLIISYIYLPETTISPQVSILSILSLGIKVLIAISLSVLIKYKPSLVSSNLIQFKIGIRFLLEIPFIT